MSYDSVRRTRRKAREKNSAAKNSFKKIPTPKVLPKIIPGVKNYTWKNPGTEEKNSQSQKFSRKIPAAKVLTKKIPPVENFIGEKFFQSKIIVRKKFL